MGVYRHIPSLPPHLLARDMPKIPGHSMDTRLFFCPRMMTDVSYRTYLGTFNKNLIY